MRFDKKSGMVIYRSRLHATLKRNCQLDELNQQVEALEAKTRDVSGEARQKVEEQLNQLKELAEPAREKMQELMQSCEEQWQSLSAEADKTYKALVHSYNYFKSQMR